jgi:hypothetical protein
MKFYKNIIKSQMNNNEDKYELLKFKERKILKY